MTGYRSPPSLERWSRAGEEWVSERTGQTLGLQAMAEELVQSGQSGAVAYEDTWLFLPDPEGDAVTAPGGNHEPGVVLPVPAVAQELDLVSVGAKRVLH